MYSTISADFYFQAFKDTIHSKIVHCEILYFDSILTSSFASNTGFILCGQVSVSQFSSMSSGGNINTSIKYFNLFLDSDILSLSLTMPIFLAFVMKVIISIRSSLVSGVFKALSRITLNSLQTLHT